MKFIISLFPIIHVIVILAGIVLLVFVKKKYPRVRNLELIAVFILFIILVLIFTEPGMDFLKRLISYLQV
ncbi:MAG TPA: hypothetical protein PLB14_11995 [Smithellaceae bacterium]|jgi:hypothetical protein|nr:hypothetical protein [Syntrophaceae bacterium]HPV50424.1 hypothetical protein [Smithellaceae bacterium]